MIIEGLKSYYETLLGQVARRHLRRRILALWPKEKLAGQFILGIGYALPYLRPYTDYSAFVFAALPETLGTSVSWPREGPNVACVSQEARLPFADQSMDRIILCHCLEHSAHRADLLSELTRVLKNHGRALIILPNRLGLWAGGSATPYYHGQALAPLQLRSWLKPHGLQAGRVESALFFPPWQNRAALTFAPLLERMGHKIARSLGGVLLVEIHKTQLSPTFIGHAAKAKSKPVLIGAGA